VSEEVILRELIAQKDTQIGRLQADNQQLRLENKLLREKVDLLIKRIFGSQSEKLDAAQLELLLKGIDPGKADASTPEHGPLDPTSQRMVEADLPSDQRRIGWVKTCFLNGTPVERRSVWTNSFRLASPVRYNVMAITLTSVPFFDVYATAHP